MPAVKKRKKAEPVTLNNKSNGKGFFSKNMFIVLAFVIPFVLMTAAFGVMKVSPFGDNQILVTDLWHQYYPFLADMQEIAVLVMDAGRRCKLLCTYVILPYEPAEFSYGIFAE